MNSFESTKCQIFVGCTTNFNSQRLHFLHQNLYFLEMNSRLSSSTPFLLLLQFSLLLFSIKFPPCWSLDSFSSCSKPFNCGNITNIDYPFWGDDRVEACGHPDLHLKCDENKTTTIKIKDVVYEVLKIDQNTQILQIKRDDFFESKGLCSPKYPNTTFDSQLFEYAPGFAEITINYDCPALKGVPGYFSCPDWSTYKDVFIQVASETHPGCSSNLQVGIGVNYFGDFWSMEEALIREGFGVKYKVDTLLCKEGCTGSGGVCVHDVDSNKPTCHCPDGNSRESPCPPQRPPSAQLKGSSNKLSVGEGIAVGAGGLAVIFIGFYICFFLHRRKKRAMLAKSKDLPTPPSSKSLPVTSMNFSQSIPSYPSSKSDLEKGNFEKGNLEKGSTYFGVQVFTYAELEEATDNFNPSRELGEGGFGTVYYGNLSDGRVVAVKRLYENNFKRVEQFMNEVEILTLLNHKNLVKLYGCTSKRSRELLLVYEYIPNGTVADHIHGKRSSTGLLSWPVRMNIAIETAEALAYLHKKDIIHRDVKSNNILLDNNFCVKVADFGLSRLFPNDVTHVSTAPQGTPGYVDPEYYQCYQLTDKSDVYSFGVVLAELVSSLQAVDTNRHRHDINLANMVVSKIQNHSFGELVDPALGFEMDDAIRRMTTAVSELAFRCLQQERDMRPSMEEVVKVLKAIKNEGLELEKVEVVDIVADEIGLLKNLPPPLSPDSVVADKWVSSSTTPSSF